MLCDMIIDDSFVLFLLLMIDLKIVVLVLFIFENRKSQEIVEKDV